MQQGQLFLIPVTLGTSNPLEVLPISIRTKIEQLNHFIVENEKASRAFIKLLAPNKKQDKLRFFQLNKYTNESELPEFLKPCLDGVSIGLMSDAGCPGIADPGEAIVKIAHQLDITIVPMVGPTSIILTLMASGLNGQSFAFNGYLPIDSGLRKRKIKDLEKRAKSEDQSQLFMETPYRNNKLFQDCLKYLHPLTYLTIGLNMTLPNEYVKTKSIADWKKIESTMNLDKQPCIFAIGSEQAYR
ncbi:MAG: SAM-dependent methyltransferase [Flavobacteriaceae bacterium]|nr:SAM-dependent methyltransferase [Flavobacteriaceae bacterium]